MQLGSRGFFLKQSLVIAVGGTLSACGARVLPLSESSRFSRDCTGTPLSGQKREMYVNCTQPTPAPTLTEIGSVTVYYTPSIANANSNYKGANFSGPGHQADDGSPWNRCKTNILAAAGMANGFASALRANVNRLSASPDTISRMLGAADDYAAGEVGAIEFLGIALAAFGIADFALLAAAAGLAATAIIFLVICFNG